MVGDLRTDALGIKVAEHPFDRGYWGRFNGLPRPSSREARKGWDTCNAELRAEAVLAEAEGKGGGE